jgi:hypothetical protein
MKSLLICAVFALGTISQAQAASGFTKVGNVTTLTYSDATCPNQSTCYYQVTALDASGFESAPAACASTQLCVGGNIAVAVMPSSGTHTVALAWLASGSTGVTYNVYRHIGPLPASGLGATVN